MFVNTLCLQLHYLFIVSGRYIIYYRNVIITVAPSRCDEALSDRACAFLWRRISCTPEYCLVLDVTDHNTCLQPLHCQ
jgi:hypothetical protein